MNKPLIAIVGETAGGKSALALDLAERWNGEIVCADSRTVYTGMDIGTAKPSPADRARVRHHGIDIVTPDQAYTAAGFQAAARLAIADIEARGKLPIVVGGTGLYVDALLYGFTFRSEHNPELRAQLEKLPVQALQQKIVAQGLPMPRNEQNPRHLIRVLETNGHIPERGPLRPNTCIVGLHIPRETIKQRIAERVDAMFAQGLEAEVNELVEQYGWNAEAMKAIGYREFRSYLEHMQTIQQVREQIVQDTQQYAKRQRTWFRRNPDVLWCDTSEQAARAVANFLSNSAQ